MQPAPVFKDSQEGTLKDSLQRFTRKWYWFVLCVIVLLAGAKVYLRYTIPSYQTKASIVIKDEASSGGLGSMLPFSEGGYLGGMSNSNLDSELAILKSKRLVSAAVDELNLHIRYENIGSIITSELYENKPFVVQYLSFKDSLKEKRAPRLFFEILSETQFSVSTEDKSIDSVENFGEALDFNFGKITVIPVFDNPTQFSDFVGKTISVTYSPIESVALQYQNMLIVEQDGRFSDVINLSMKSPVPKKAEDFIDVLVIEYNNDATKDKSQVAQKTSNFIDSRLDIITQELDSVETDKVEFKSSNRLTDIETEAQIILENASEFDKRQIDVRTQLELANTMLDYMQESEANDLLPANIGLQGQEVASAVANYNQLILERNRLLKNSTTRNPVVANLNNQIEGIRSGIERSLQNEREGLRIALRDLNYKEASLNDQISRVPQKEKIYRGINRQQSIKEQLYLFLLQQREEANISLAVTADKAKVIDHAFSSKTPVSPNKMLIYLGALISGLVLPFVVIYAIHLINTKVQTRTDVEKSVTTANFLGEIPKLSSSEDELIKENDRSMLAESFRILRTNLQYQFIDKIDKTVAKRIFVTSTIKGEGKTFVAFNMGLSLAMTGKKVLLVGADIRNPQIHRYLPDGKMKSAGLTEYLVDTESEVKDIIKPSGINSNLQVIHSGSIPPNPAELLMKPRTATFFNELESQFDYIIVDTAPSMLVTDTVLINKYADVMMYVVRAGYTDKRLLDFLSDSIENGRLS
ncbi:MAG: polysaccharide biosynthesis tyrosine autokinase, partial [Marinirhabdus sp.]|nr:polysaccharide biosynthesis tyrosine autokinase [Marinirhabdus sp.]